MAFLWYILIGLAAGWIAGLIWKGSGNGVLMNIVIGIIGSVLGGWIFGLFGVATTSLLGNLVCAVIGAIVLLWIVSLFRRRA